MPRFSRRQFSFTNGEVSPLLWGRADMDFYYASLAKCVNWLPDHKGNLHRRPPSKLVGKSKNNECPCLIRFPVGRDCPVMISSYSDCFEFYTDQSQFTENGQPLRLSHTYGEDFCDLEYAQDCSALFIVHESHPPAILEKTDDGFSLNPLNAFPFDELNRDEGCQLQLEAGSDGQTTMTGVSCDVGDVIQLTQDGGQTLESATVTAVNGGNTCEVTFTGDVGAYEVFDGNTASGNVLISRSRACLNSVGCSPFTQEMVGQFVRVLDENGRTTPASEDETDGNLWVEARVLEFVNSEKIIVDYDGPSLVQTDLFQLPLFVDGRYPESVWIHQDRLWFGLDNCIIGSETGNFTGFSPTDTDGTVNPDNAIYQKVNNGQCTDVRWMWTSGNHLLTGTAQGVFSITGAGVNGSFQADAVAQRLNSSIGVADIRPVQVGENVVFVDRARCKLYNTGFGGQFEQITLDELSLFSDHIGDQKFKKITYQENPYKIIWGITECNELFSVTYDPRQQVRGWARHQIGGQLIVNGCCVAAEVCDLETIPGVDEETDDVYIVVKRTIQGEDRYSIEVLDTFHDTASIIEDSIYLDGRIDLSNEVEIPELNFKGPQGFIQLLDGSYAIRDKECWHYFDVKDFRYEFCEFIDCPEAGRDWVFEDSEWRLLEKPRYCDDREKIKEIPKSWRPPCNVNQIRSAVTVIGGLDCFEGERLIAYTDGVAQDITVLNGEANVSGSIVSVGYEYESCFELLPYRQNLGSTDGANDPFTISDVSLYLYDAVHIEMGSGECNLVRGQLEHYERMQIDQSTHKKISSFEGWASAPAFTGVNSTNSDFGLSIRALGPYPCIVRGIETIINASGGR